MSNETEEHEYPNIVERFHEVFSKLGIKKADAYVDHCAKGDLENLDDIEQKLYEMGLHPSLRTQVINFWAAEIKQPVPTKIQKRLAEERGTKVRGEAQGERELEKYSVDETGAIRVALTTDKTALTWDEAEKLSKQIKKELNEKHKGEKVTYVYDTETGQVRMAKEGEIGGTLEQAKELKKMAEEGRGKGEVESPFITDEEGNWNLNPKARVTGVELMALESIRRSQEKGEPVDPLEALRQAAEKMKVYQEALGGGAGKMPEWMADPAKFMDMVQTIAGGGKDSGALKELKDELTRVRDDLHQSELRHKDEQIEALANAIHGYKDEVRDLRADIEKNRDLTGRTAYDLIGSAIEKLDHKVPDKGDIRQMITELVSKGPKLVPRGPKEREAALEGMATGIEQAAEVKAIEDKWWALG